MDRSSFFIKHRALFGSFPDQQAVNELEEQGVRYFINLTHDSERKIVPYHTQHTYISYPIVDHRIPSDRRGFAKFALKLAKIIRELETDSLVYLHCKGGHGRSGVVVAVLLCYLFNLTPNEALERTSSYHSKRLEMREKWRKIGSPQTFQQKNFVYHFCRPISFYRAYMRGHTAGFSNFTDHSVSLEGYGVFPTSEAAFQALKSPDDDDYLRRQRQAKSAICSRVLGSKVKLRSDWYSVKVTLMFTVLRAKFDQHQDIRENLLETGLCPIIHRSRADSFWGDGGDGKGANRLGELLCRLRADYYRALPN